MLVREVEPREGYDFYPPQTIQPFALIDSLGRAGLAAAAGVGLTAFDLSPAVLGHLEAARARAAMGAAYTVVLPRNLDQPWTADLVAYRERVGDQIGKPVEAAAPPPMPGASACAASCFRRLRSARSSRAISTSCCSGRGQSQGLASRLRP